ncbi:MAG: phosphatase PAP2 family protein [Telluria sp.]
MFETFNKSLFIAIHGSAHLSHWQVLLGTLCAEWLIMLVPLMLVLMWMSGAGPLRTTALRALVAAGIALALNGALGHLWFHPRPFMLGLAENVLHHDPDSSFPSDHGTIMFTIAFVLLSQPLARLLGWTMLAAAIGTAWARVYLGVHWPLDMAGAAVMAAFVTMLTSTSALRSLCQFILSLAEPTYRRLCAHPIRRGWLRP